MTKKKTLTPIFESLSDIVCSLAEQVRPPERLSVSETAERYRYVNNPGSYVGKWKNSTAPYLKEMQDIISDSMYYGLIVAAPAQSGKALALDTPIPTPTGWTTMGAISVGDTVIGADGKPTLVDLVSEIFHNHQCFKVIFDDGHSITADAEHRWEVRDARAENTKVITTQEMVGLGVKYKQGKRCRFRIDNAPPIQLPERQLPIDPYIMGLWLGDGSKSSGFITPGGQDQESIIAELEARGCEVTTYVAPKKDRCDALRVVLPCGRKLVSVLRQTGWLRASKIPETYLRASEEQRRELLRGLMDTDGSASGSRRVEFYQTNYGIAKSFAELASSLGHKPTLKTKAPPPNTHYTESYRVGFSCDDPREAYRLERKIKAARSVAKGRPTQYGQRSIIAIEPTASVPTRCIRVESPRHLYLAGENMVPTHNTDALCINPIVHAVRVAGFDLIIYSPTQTDARDFSIRRVDRLNRHSKDVGERLLKSRDTDNKFDKQYSNGVLLTLGHPSVSQLAGKPVPWVVLTDYDRMPEDIGGDGSPYDLASKRTTTFGSFAMAAAESSPSRPVTNLRWIRATPHQAPPTTGILSLYNRGDRRMWYWKCPHEDCGEHFIGNFKMLRWDKQQPSFSKMAETTYLECPHCSSEITWDQRDAMQQSGRWLADGQVIDTDGEVYGEPMHTGIASFWLNGMAAAFITWGRLVINYLNANNEYEQTGSEEALKKFYNTDLAEPYYPKSEEAIRQPEVMKSREEPLTQQAVPEGVRFLLATIDVQKNMFIVQVHGIIPGAKVDVVVIDRFDIRKSERLDEDGDHHWTKPHAYPEDWDLITTQVIERTYPLGDNSGRRMKIKMTACDSGGKAGATANAYEYYRRLRKKGLSTRFVLLKGASTANAPRVRLDYPDSNRKDRFAGARGDVPVLFFNSNMLKDDLDGRLDVLDPGQGLIRFPDWLPEWFYAELCVEVRVDGMWKNPKNNRNESWDLLYYVLGLAYSPYIRVDKIDWDNPLSWYAGWDNNSLVIEGETEHHVEHATQQATKKPLSLRELGEALA